MAVRALESWRGGAVRESILAFVRSVRGPGPTFVPEVDRIAAFDNDTWLDSGEHEGGFLDRFRATSGIAPVRAQADFLLGRPGIGERVPR
jgi:hypothetical protein